MIDTPLEAYEQLVHGDLVVDADGDLLKVCGGTVMDLMRFGDECTATIDCNGALSNTPWVATFPLRKVVVIAAEALHIAGPTRRPVRLDEGIRPR